MNGKTIVLGVSGGIAAYKACDLASKLTQSGAIVRVVMTQSATRFVAPLTFQALTQHPVHTSLWPDNSEASGTQAAMAHIGLANEADAILIAPASADVLARLANGLSDDLLSTLVLATHAPVLLAPAMNPTMLAHAATQRNLGLLRDYGYHLIEPENGRMACEHVGAGRLPPTETLLEALRGVLEPKRDLEGKTILITAGPTREALDPVRYISNRSSGKMGYALASEAAQRGAKVILISGPSMEIANGVERIDVTTTQEMFDAAVSRAAECDIVIAAAAPADFRPSAPVTSKIKKGSERIFSVDLVPTPDIIAAIAQHKKLGQIVVGFAAETGNPVAQAQRKLHEKNLDAIVANDVMQPGAGFDVDTNRVTWITAQNVEEWPLMPKTEVAARILDAVGRLSD